MNEATKQTNIRFLDQMYSWRNMTLWDFLSEGNIPSKWNFFFLRDDVQRELWKISEYIKGELEYSKRLIVYPPINRVFRAFIDPKKIKVCILAQDPYHNGSAVGYCFSVLPGNKINPSLRNIYKELKQEEYKVKEDGNLTHWAKQGCLLLNTALTVEKGCADSHTAPWYDFTEKVIKYVAENCENIVWLLMGSKAQRFQEFIPESHGILCSSHPSPFSAHRGYRDIPAFLGSNIFSRTNDYLEAHGKNPINW